MEQTVDDLLGRFAQIHLPTVSGGTRIRYELDIKYRIQPFFEGCFLSKVEQLAIEAFRAEIMKTLSPKSVNNCTALLALLFNKAVGWGMLEKNPVTLKSLKLPEVKYLWWDDKSLITAFLAEAKNTRHYAAYLLALECGLRLGEIVGLDRSGVDLERCQLHISQQWLERESQLGPTKGRRLRVLNFDPRSDLGAALNQAMKSSRHRDAIFTAGTGNRIHPTMLRAKVFSRVVKKSRVPRIRFHDLRHTFASWYMLEHDDIWELMRILGHADITTTQRYAHLSARQRGTSCISWSGARSREPR